MDESNADRLRNALDLFILKRFSDDGLLSFFEVQQRAKPIHALLDLLATRMGKPSLGSLPAVLQRLHREGWLKREPQSVRETDAGFVYVLTEIGERRVKKDSARFQSMLSQFVEDGDMNKSFRRFLDLEQRKN